MTLSEVPQCQPGEDFDFLCVDDFLKDMVAAQALKSALELGLIDQLREEQAGTFTRIEQQWGGDRRALALVLDLLAANRVVERLGDEVQLTRRFRVALRYRDLLEAKLDFANLVAPDLIGLFPWLLVDPARFMRQARIFDLFGYHRCFEPSPENYAATKRWMRFTTCLTRYEAQACMRFHDFGRYERMLDIGGNSGEFILQVRKRHTGLRGTVFDLPVVCDVGRDHVRGEAGADRIDFLKGNALIDPLPTGFDLITFKSMLHDWPEGEATRFLARARQALDPCGTLLIFERAPIEVGPASVPYSMIPMLLFFRSFRSPSFYQERLEELGYEEIAVQTIHLEMPFFLVTARRGG
jgi:ubiquinone/menaquinone biosynthesis C-methylase UbiE